MTLDRIGQLINGCESSGWRMALAVLDIDHFKRVNDTGGRGYGDELLQALASRMRKRLSPEVTVARLGGDEFALVFAAGDLARIRKHLGELFTLLRSPFDGDEGPIYVTASAGVAVCPDDGSVPSELFRKADTALNEAKADRRNRWEFFSQGLEQRVGREATLINRLREALEGEGIQVAFQPVVNATSGEIESLEALARWTDSAHGPVVPGEFIPIAEEAGLVNQLTASVIEASAATLAVLPQGAPHGLSVAINVSAVQLADHGFAAWFLDHCTGVGLAPQRVTVEVKESGVIDAANVAVSQIRQLRRGGCQVVLDDFGTGYSSLAYLRRMPLDGIKIDRQFVAVWTNRAASTASWSRPSSRWPGPSAYRWSQRVSNDAPRRKRSLRWAHGGSRATSIPHPCPRRISRGCSPSGLEASRKRG